MAISPDIITKLTSHIGSLVQTVSITMSEACNKQVSITEPTLQTVLTQDLLGSQNEQMVVVQFALNPIPENPMVVLINQESGQNMASAVLDQDEVTLDENTMADIRPTLEGLVQGICLSVGQIRNDPVVASGLSIRFQPFAFPHNLEKLTEMLQIKASFLIDGADEKGEITWLFDPDSAYLILGEKFVDETPFEQMAGDANAGGAPQPSGQKYEDVSGLDILLDIPLEISVELGRMKMLVKDVLELGTGSIVELDKSAGEPVDVMVNGRLVAKGEVVVIDENFGVRVTEILNPQERLQRLNDAA
ncbi:MAG: flagellar motor switch protein FliN [Armatimonadetes bacterium]|nr:flagellar motor switch protein FliN [Armatimonadota bacterium]